jgi:hypothetical protein
MSDRKLVDFARIIRSKNAGPGLITIDLFFNCDEDYSAASTASGLSAEAVGKLYGVSANRVRVIPYPLARAIKITMDRLVTAGSPGDSDVYGAQQHALLLDVVVPG